MGSTGRAPRHRSALPSKLWPPYRGVGQGQATATSPRRPRTRPPRHPALSAPLPRPGAAPSASGRRCGYSGGRAPRAPVPEAAERRLPSRLLPGPRRRPGPGERRAAPGGAARHRGWRARRRAESHPQPRAPSPAPSRSRRRRRAQR